MISRKVGSTLLLASMLLTGCSSGADTSGMTVMERIIETGELNVGISTDKIGFALENTATKELEGFEVDLSERIADDIEAANGLEDGAIEVVYTKVNAQTRVSMLDEGSIDMVAASYTDTPKRAEQWNCSSAYFNDGVSVMTKKGVYPGGVMDFLDSDEPVKIAIGLGTTSGAALTDEYAIAELGWTQEQVDEHIEIMEYSTTDEILIALDSGIVDGWCVDYTYLKSYLNDTLEIFAETAAGDMFAPQPLGIVTVYNNGTVDEDLEWTEFVQDEVRTFWGDGSIAGWLETWGFPTQEAPDTLDEQYGPYFHIDQE